MKTFKSKTIFLLLILLMAFSALFPLLLSKANDQRVLGQMHIHKVELLENNHPTPYSMIDKMRLLYDKHVKSKDIVVVQNAHLSEVDLKNLNGQCLAEIQKLSEKKLLPDLEDDFTSNGCEGSSFTLFDTTRPDLVVNLYAIIMYDDQYRISFTMDADTNKIYELNMKSAVKPLIIDIDNSYLYWKNYIGLSLEQSNDLLSVERSDEVGEVSEGSDTFGISGKDYLVDDRTFEMGPVVVHDYTDGNKMVSYKFFLANDKKEFTISLSFQ
ncbi:hypothetical protein [Paenibacillus paridis]|uniref:hypothetical protein n=1 Tax=Paenibacillus paridis TaxID=2583376 RepID=UPI0011233073|nr:hypothetical protein [Paenibacillus paridis]